MTGDSAESRALSSVTMAAADVSTASELARLLRQLHRRHGRQRQDAPLTYREMAAELGWSHGIIGDYFTGKALPPTDRFDVLTELLGATDLERGALATARDRVEEHRRRAPASAGTGTVPRQLPGETSAFVGRDDALVRLDQLLASTRHRRGVAIALVSGTAGVGKTTLAVRFAHRVAHRFPDGQLHLNLRGFHPSGSAVTPVEAMRILLDGLGVAPDRIPVDAEAQAALFRSLLAGRRVLLVLDNAATEQQVRPLLPGSSGCLVLVTSRNQLPGLVAVEGAEPILLDLFSAAEAHQLLSDRLGAARLSREVNAAGRLVATCAGLPLALTIVSARAAAQPAFPLTVIADEIDQTGNTLDGLHTGDPSTDMRGVLSWSYRRLDPEAARLFRQLGMHPGPDIAAGAAASLAGLSMRRVRALLAELTRAHLLVERSPGRYAFHDLLRDYARELAESASDQLPAVHRLLDHYLHTAFAATLLGSPHRDPVVLAPPAPGVTPTKLADRDAALAWFVAEHRVLVAAVRMANDFRLDTHTWQLAWSLKDFLHWQGHTQDQAEVHRLALDAAQRSGDLAAVAHAHHGLARAYTRMDKHADAETHLLAALDLRRELNDRDGQSHTHQSLATVLELQGRLKESLQHSELALGLRRATGHRWGQAESLNTIGWFQARLGDFATALANCREALALQREMGSRSGMADTLDSIGYAHLHLGQYQQAIGCYEESLALYRELGDLYNEADTLANLGEAQYAAGDPDAARRTWVIALGILERIGHLDAEKVRAKLM